MKIDTGKRVRMQIELAVVDGDVIESSTIEYVHGDGTMLAGLESALAGLEADAEKSGVIAAKDAFGVEETLPTKKIPRVEFPKDTKLEVGETFVAKGPKGADVQFKVIEVGDDAVTVRFMHPLAGKDISYKAKILRVTDTKPPPIPPKR